MFGDSAKIQCSEYDWEVERYRIGRLKGKSSVRIHRDYIKGKGNAKGFHFWSTGYCVSTAGLDEGKVREYIRNQEETERRQEELDLDD